MLVPYSCTVVASGFHLQLIHVLSSNILLYLCCALWLVALAEGHELNQTNYAHECVAHALAHLLHLSHEPTLDHATTHVMQTQSATKRKHTISHIYNF